jgi:hypothetical protein
MGHGGFKVQMQHAPQSTSARVSQRDAVEKLENKRRFPLSHRAAAAIFMNLNIRFVAFGI